MGNVIPWGAVGWTLAALTADPWNIKPKMFSLGENLALLQNSRITAPAAAARCPECRLLLAFLDRSHAFLPVLSRPITVGEKVKTRKDRLLALWLSDPVPLHLCLPPSPTHKPHRQGDHQMSGAWSQDSQKGPRPAPPSPTCFSVLGRSCHLWSYGLGRQERTSGMLHQCSHTCPPGLVGLAGAGRLQACELTLGSELWGISELLLAGLIPKPVWPSLNPAERPKRCQTG